MTGVELIAVERKRQIEVKGHTDAKDEGYWRCELVLAARAYIQEDGKLWPWKEGFKLTQNHVRNLVKAGALIAAELDRCLRCPKVKRQFEFEPPLSMRDTDTLVVIKGSYILKDQEGYTLQTGVVK